VRIGFYDKNEYNYLLTKFIHSWIPSCFIWCFIISTVEKSWNKPISVSACRVRRLKNGASLKGRTEIWRSFFEQEQDRNRKWKLGTKGQRKRIRRKTRLLLLPQGLPQSLNPHHFTRGYKISKELSAWCPVRDCKLKQFRTETGTFLKWIGKKFTTQAYICMKTSKFPFTCKDNIIRKMTGMCYP